MKNFITSSDPILRHYFLIVSAIGYFISFTPNHLDAQQDSMGFERICVIDSLHKIISIKDLDHDGLLDIIGSGPQKLSRSYCLKIFEKVNDTSFIESYYGRSHETEYPEWVGDSDNDGLMELMTSRTDSSSIFRKLFLYEATDRRSYPDTNKLVWIGEKFDVSRIYCEDTDNDGRKEFIYAHYRGIQNNDHWTLDFWECKGDNSYSLVDTISIFDSFNNLSFGDLDGDGFCEIFFGTLHGYVYIIKTLADNKHVIKCAEKTQSQNTYSNAYLGDADGDQRNEFVVAGNNPEAGYTLITIYSFSNNLLQKKWDYHIYNFPFGYPRLYVGDIDGDGKKEFCFNNQGDSTWFLKITSDEGLICFARLLGGYYFHLFDIDGDNRAEIFLYENSGTSVFRYSKIASNARITIDADRQLEIGAFQNYPNPFNPETFINYDVKDASHIRLTVYDVLGREITTLVNSDMQQGRYTVRWNASNVTSGAYSYRLNATDQSGKNLFTKSQRMMLMK